MLDITKKITIIFLIMFCAFIAKAQNLILNGSFEINTPSSTYPCTGFNSSNVIYVTLFDGLDVGLMKDSCLMCSPPVYWGGGAAEGHWFVEMANYDSQSTVGEKLSFDLNAPLAESKNYKLSFSIRKPPLAPLGCIDARNNYVKVGVSNYNNQFGTLLYTSPLGDSIWTEYSVVFNTQNAEEYITVEVGTGDTANIAIHIDNFILVETTEQPNAVYEVNGSNKKLLKIVDILGKETSPKQKGILFYIFSDGTVEKRIAIE